jgi:hypothetical protein
VGTATSDSGCSWPFAFLDANAHDLEASGEETNHVFRYVAASETEDHEGILALLTHWFEQAIRPLTVEE